MNLTNDMALIEQHWEEGQRLQRCGCFTAEEWSQHQAISYSALMVLGIDGMQQLAKACLLKGAAEMQAERADSPISVNVDGLQLDGQADYIARLVNAIKPTA